MTSDDLIKIMGVVVTFIIAWLGYQQVKPKNAGDAVYATAQSVVLLSSRVRELENEKADLSDRLEAEITRLRGELDMARTVVAELRQTIQRGEAAMKDLQKQFDQDRVIRDEVVKALTDKVSALENSNNDLTTRLNAAQQRIAALEDENDRLRSQLSKASGFGVR